MDFVTHTLMGAGLARLSCPRRDWLPQFSLAGVLGSLLQDGDSWLYLLGPNYYGQYHRVASHSFVGLAVIGSLAGILAWSASRVAPWRRFGWFVSPNLAAASPPEQVPLAYLQLVGLGAAFLHWIADAITGFGNLYPFWPWSNREASIAVVTSFDLFLFSSTLGWHLLLRSREWSRMQERKITAGYAVLAGGYVLARLAFGSRTVW